MFDLDYIAINIRRTIDIYRKAHIESPIIPVINPAFPSLLPISLAVFAPNTIANIPVGMHMYQNNPKIIDTIPNVNAATLIPVLLFSFT